MAVAFLVYIKPLSVPENPRGCVITNNSWYGGMTPAKLEQEI